MAKSDESHDRRVIQDMANRTRQDLERAGKPVPSQEQQEKVIRKIIIDHDKKQDRK